MFVLLCINYRSFDVRKECLYREYFYLLPAKTIGIKDGCSSEEVQEHLSEFNNILKGFKVCPFNCVSYPIL
jgi:tRNA pseudouridine38-40 synthase